MIIKKDINKVPLKDSLSGINRQNEINLDVLKNGKFLPNTVSYEDIDTSFKEFIDNDLSIDFEDKKIKSYLTTQQRFSEFMRTWEDTDETRTILMNFITIYRNPNPNKGTIHGQLYNIPGNRYYTMFSMNTWENNRRGKKIFKMKQPYSVDLEYEVRMITNKYTLLNDFNTLVNDLFKSRQAYISPNGYFMPILLNETSDDSQYDFNERKYYVQTFKFNVLAYLINENDIKVEFAPNRSYSTIETDTSYPNVQVDLERKGGKFSLNFFFPSNSKISSKVVIPNDMDNCLINLSDNVLDCELFINNSKIDPTNSFSIKSGSKLAIKIKRRLKANESSIKIYEN